MMKDPSRKPTRSTSTMLLLQTVLLLSSANVASAFSSNYLNNLSNIPPPPEDEPKPEPVQPQEPPTAATPDFTSPGNTILPPPPQTLSPPPPPPAAVTSGDSYIESLKQATTTPKKDPTPPFPTSPAFVTPTTTATPPPPVTSSVSPVADKVQEPKFTEQQPLKEEKEDIASKIEEPKIEQPQKDERGGGGAAVATKPETETKSTTTTATTTITKESDSDSDSGSLDLGAVTVDKASPEKKWRVNNSVNTPSDDGSGKSRTQRIMESTATATSGQTGGAGGSSTWDAFVRAEENWKKLRLSKGFEYDKKLLRLTQDGVPPPQQFVTMDGAVGNPKSWSKLRKQYQDEGLELDFDVVVCGGTLGIFIATALQLQGHKVCVIEGGPLQGREQEWNVSMKELLELVELGVLFIDDIEAAVTTEFPGCRSGFKNREAPVPGTSYLSNGIGYECFTDDVLNLGISPSILLERVKDTFEEMGGVVKDFTRIEGIVVSEALGAAVDIGIDAEPVTARLVLDCMGNASPISRQQRYGMKPDGVCCVVGTCAGGYDKEDNVNGDIIYTNSEIQDKGDNGMLQYFWEAFPVGIGRDGKDPGTSDVKTTYMFTYLDADEKRPDLLTLMEDYWDALPIYQPSIQDPERDLEVKRTLFAYFPTYKDSPLQPEWSRVLAVGDASGIQSPLSFGGFGALTRHLERISGALCEALEKDCLHKDDLALINAYTPNLSAAWMFQKAMSVRMGQKVDPKFINRLLATNFMVMEDMGDKTMKPFLQDVVRFDGLVGSLARSFVEDPTFMPQIVSHVGVPTLIDWLGHLYNIGKYSAAHTFVSPLLGPVANQMNDQPREQFRLRRQMEAWKFGSGSDYIIPRGKK